jgi:hypothetical protein
VTKEELARAIATGIIETGIEGDYGSVSCSTAGDYPSIGVSQWEGERANRLLENISGGCLLYTSPSPRDRSLSRMPSSA